jgi:hypothetical protein
MDYSKICADSLQKDFRNSAEDAEIHDATVSGIQGYHNKSCFSNNVESIASSRKSSLENDYILNSDEKKELSP